MRIQEPSDAILALRAAEHCAQALDKERFEPLKDMARLIVWQSVACALPIRGSARELADLSSDITRDMAADVLPTDIPVLSGDEAELLAEALEHFREAYQLELEHAHSPYGTAKDRFRVSEHPATLKHIDDFLQHSRVAA